MFGGSLVIGLRASAPLELVRRRQAEFTADASHELRTPLSVIEAEVELALRLPRPASEYREVLERVGGEGRRLRRIVDDLLWLARVDDQGMAARGGSDVDVAAVARDCTERFQAVASTRGVHLTFESVGGGAGGGAGVGGAGVVPAAPIIAETDWIDRLIGVLIDNACKFAGAGGRASVTVHVAGNRIVLRVDDSGPGIPSDQRSLVLDRFHRSDSTLGGTGLGLAIADSVVRATHGAWVIEHSPLGGARLQVSWRKASSRRGPAAVAPGPPAAPAQSTDRPSPSSRTPQEDSTPAHNG
jgi:signal transduction histidine kinase